TAKEYISTGLTCGEASFKFCNSALRLTGCRFTLSRRNAHFQSRRPVLVFVGVIEVGAAGRASVRPWNGGNQAHREIELVFGLEVAPVEDDFPADDFVGVDFAGLDQFFKLIVPDL